MKSAVDLHIHSALSPCAGDDMTPNNIVNMALLKGLDFIAVTDHNSMENVAAVLKCAENTGIVAVPGMELETKEEVHIVCLFPEIGSAMEMQGVVYKALPPLFNREEIFGHQLIMDEMDNVVGKLERMLLTAANIELDEAIHTVYSLGGAVIPAHIDRESYSVISNLGFIPADLNVKYLELSKNACEEACKSKFHIPGRFELLKSSDAHSLGDILERECFLEIDNKSAKSLIKILRP